jgi:hypothetical protein
MLIDRRDRGASRPDLLPLRAEVRRNGENRRRVRAQERPLEIPAIEANYRIQPKQVWEPEHLRALYL